MPGVNKSTIYRNLDIFEHLGCVLKSESGDHIIYHHSEEGHHITWCAPGVVKAWMR